MILEILTGANQRKANLRWPWHHKQPGSLFNYVMTQLNPAAFHMLKRCLPSTSLNNLHHKSTRPPLFNCALLSKWFPHDWAVSLSQLFDPLRLQLPGRPSCLRDEVSQRSHPSMDSGRVIFHSKWHNSYPAPVFLVWRATESLVPCQYDQANDDQCPRRPSPRWWRSILVVTIRARKEATPWADPRPGRSIREGD